MSMTKINWYPGHMKKTKDLIKDNMQLIDIVLEVVDARKRIILLMKYWR